MGECQQVYLKELSQKDQLGSSSGGTTKWASATRPSGDLNVIENASLYVPTPDGGFSVCFTVMPSISDSKSANYSAQAVMGRATPLMVYSNSSERKLSLELTFMATSRLDDATVGSLKYNAKCYRAIASATYPRKGDSNTPYLPPVICTLQYGSFLFTGEGGESPGELCVIVRSYSVKNDPAIPTDPETLIPFKFNMSVELEAVYSSDNLPNQDRIWTSGR